MELALRELWVDSSLRESEVARRRGESLFNGAIDHFFHYQGSAQAKLWLDVHRSFAPHFTDAAFSEIFRALFAQTVASMNEAAVDVVALGPGAGSKERMLLETLVAAGIDVRYTPIDASVELALMSADGAPSQVQAVDPVAGDLSMLSSISPWLELRSPGRRRIITAFGISPNFVPSALFNLLRSVVRQGDVLLFSANLAGADESSEAYERACETVREQYDNPPTKRWLSQVLRDWELESRLSEPRFEIGTIEGVRAFIASCAWRSDVQFLWDGREFRARAGDPLRLFFSLRYTPGRLADAMSPFGLHLVTGQVTPDAREGVWSVSLRA